MIANALFLNEQIVDSKQILIQVKEVYKVDWTKKDLVMHIVSF